MPNALQTELTRKPTPEPVEDTARWPEWAEEARLDDELTAKAYEATPPSCRAALKTGLALEPARPALPSAIYLRPEAARGHCRAHRHGPFRYTGSLALSPGCEGFWLHEDLTPDFFTVSRQAFGPL